MYFDVILTLIYQRWLDVSKKNSIQCQFVVDLYMTSISLVISKTTPTDNLRKYKKKQNPKNKDILQFKI